MPEAVATHRCLFIAAGGLALALPAASVQTIHGELRVYAVPGTQAPLVGLTTLQGQLVPLSDLGLAMHARASQGRILQLAGLYAPAALRVDAVFGIGAAPLEPFNGSERKRYGARAGLGSGTLAWKGRRHALIDLDALFADPRFVAITADEPDAMIRTPSADAGSAKPERGAGSAPEQMAGSV